MKIEFWFLRELKKNNRDFIKKGFKKKGFCKIKKKKDFAFLKKGFYHF
jgi:hypothetical protein